MAGVPAGLPAGVRLSDHICLGVIARAVPPGRVRQVLAETGRASERERDLPAQVMVYYAIALALYMTSGTREVLRCLLLEGLRRLWCYDEQEHIIEKRRGRKHPVHALAARQVNTSGSMIHLVF